MRSLPSAAAVLLALAGCHGPVAPVTAKPAPTVGAPAPKRELAPSIVWRSTVHHDGAEPRALLRYQHGASAFSCEVTTENVTESAMFSRPQEVKGRHVVDVRRERGGRFVATISSFAIGVALFQDALYRVTGAPSMTFDVDARGLLQDVTFAPYRPLTHDDPAVVALEKARSSREPLDLHELDRLLAPLRRQREQVLRSSVEAMWAPLPETPVGAGASWTVTKEWSSPGVNAGATRTSEMRRTYVLGTAPSDEPDAAIVVEHTTSAVTREAGPEASSESKSNGTGRTIVRLAGALVDHDVRESGEASGTITYEDFEGTSKTKPFESTTRGRLRIVCK